MRTFLAAIACGAAILGTGTAHAADAAVTPPTLYSADPVADTWSGFYLGLNAGYGRAKVVSTANLGLDDMRGAFGGVQAGWNHQMGSFVVGVEADIQAAHLTQTVNSSIFSLQYFGTLRGRVGVDIASRFMPYVTAGVALGGGKNDIPTQPIASKLHTGWTAGAGIETRINDKWSVKTEYIHLSLEPEAYYRGVNLNAPSAGIKANMVRAGINFRF